jgi:hypothetical protein
MRFWYWHYPAKFLVPGGFGIINFHIESSLCQETLRIEREYSYEYKHKYLYFFHQIEWSNLKKSSNNAVNYDPIFKHNKPT